MSLETNMNNEINKSPNVLKGREMGDGKTDVFLNLKVNTNNDHREVEKDQGNLYNFCEEGSFCSEGNNSEYKIRQQYGYNKIGVEPNLGYPKFHSDTESYLLQKNKHLPLFTPKQTEDQQLQRTQLPTDNCKCKLHQYQQHAFYGQVDEHCHKKEYQLPPPKHEYKNSPSHDHHLQSNVPISDVYQNERENNEISTHCRLSSQKDQMYTFKEKNNIKEISQEPQRKSVSGCMITNQYDNFDKILSERYPTATSKMFNKYKETNRQFPVSDIISEDDQEILKSPVQTQELDQRAQSEQSLKPQESTRSISSKSSTRSTHSKKAEELIKLERSKCEAFSSIKDGIEKYSSHDQKFCKKPQNTESKSLQESKRNPIDELIKQFRSNNVSNIINEAEIIKNLDSDTIKFK